MRSGGPRRARRRQSVWSRRGFAELDQRLLEAKMEREIIAGLLEHVGGRPTIVQTILIRRCARLAIMVMQLEERAITDDKLGDLAGRQICALSNSLRLSLQALGLERASEQPVTLKGYLKAV